MKLQNKLLLILIYFLFLFLTIVCIFWKLLFHGKSYRWCHRTTFSVAKMVHLYNIKPLEAIETFTKKSLSWIHQIPTTNRIHHWFPRIFYDHFWGHGGRVVTLTPPTYEAGVQILVWPQVGKLVGACRRSAVYSTELGRTVCTGFFSALPTTCHDMTCTVLKVT